LPIFLIILSIKTVVYLGQTRPQRAPTTEIIFIKNLFDFLDVYTYWHYNQNMRFEWDENKNESNIHKHGLDFSDSIEMFDSPMITCPDN